jgi:hypothetical protein
MYVQPGEEPHGVSACPECTHCGVSMAQIALDTSWSVCLMRKERCGEQGETGARLGSCLPLSMLLFVGAIDRSCVSAAQSTSPPGQVRFDICIC